MATLALVRHGKSELGFDEALNSDLSLIGVKQAKDAALHLAERYTPRRILSSPLIRARRTAEPLAEIWGQPVEIAEALTEIPTPRRPDQSSLKWRRPWLDNIMTQRYCNLDYEIETWRSNLYMFLTSQTEDAIIFTHYLTINAAKGMAIGDERVVLCNPGYCEVEQLTVLDGVICIPKIAHLSSK